MKTLKFTLNVNSFVHSGGFAAVLQYAKTADELGYDRLRLIDHVVGVVAAEHPDLPPTPYTASSEFQEVFTVMAYLSAVTKRIGFLTGVLGLPARQTALVAKQAAQVDNMSGGRLILGVGIGYNHVEFEAMGSTFKDRAPRVEEQIEVLRAFWTQPVVSYEGTWHRFKGVNINPLPVQRPIPIWMGAGRMDEPVPPMKVLQRIGRLADGFMPLFQIDKSTGKLSDAALGALETIRTTAREAGRDPTAMDLEIGIYPQGLSDTQVMDQIDYLVSIGATHIHARYPTAPLESHLEWIRSFALLRDRYLRERSHRSVA
jgi:probable F420-dependent oxidoreductase